MKRFLLSKKQLVTSNSNLYIFLTSLIFFISITNGNFWEYDSQTVFRLTQSIVDKFSFQIDCFSGSATIEGKCFSEYGLLMSIVIVPMYLLEKLFLEVFKNTYFFSGFFPSLTNAFVTAFLSVLIYNFLLKLNLNSKQAFFGSVLFVFFTYAPIYTKTLFSEPLSALLIYSSLYLLLFKKDSRNIYFIIGLLLGLSILTRITNVLYIPMFLVLGYYQRLTKKNIIQFALAYGLSIIIIFMYNFFRFGDILNTGYREIKFNYPFFIGIYLHIFSFGKSIFLYQPFTILGLLGTKVLYNLNRKLFFSFLYIFVINLLFYSLYMHPAGDWTWGDRYLYPLIFIFVILSVCFSVFYKNVLLKIIFVLLLLVSLVIQSSAIYISYHRYYNILNYKNKGNFINMVHTDPVYSPLIGQWKVILNLGLSPKESREAFTEYVDFDPNYKVASPDIFWLRSKKELPIFLLLILIEIFLLINYKYFLNRK